MILTTDQSGSDSNTPIALDPPSTVKGAIQRALLAEALEPSSRHFNPAEDLKVLRTLKRVLENRLQHPELYDASGAKDERDILMAHGQFPEFEDYPHQIPPDVQTAVDAANRKSQLQELYRQHILNAIQVSNETVDPAQTEYPDATAWKKTPKKGEAVSPGPNFYRLGDFGGNTFFGTKPEALPAKHDPVQGMTPVEKLRYYAALARAEAAAEFEKLPAHIKLIHRMTASHGQERSFAPVSRRPGTAEADHRHPATSSLPSAAPTAHRVLMPSMPTAGQKQNAGSATKPHAAHATATPQNEAAQTSPPVFHDETLDLIDRNVSQIGAAMQGLNSRGLISSLPSIAPIRPLHAPAQNAPDRVGHAALQPADIAPAGRHAGMAAPHPARRHHAGDEAGQAGDMAHHKAAAGRGRHELERQIRDLLDRQARLPPAGPSFFDPALSPAWAGHKIPT